MRNFFLFFLCIMLSCSAVYADDELSDDTGSIQDNNSNAEASAPVVVDITSLINQINEDTDKDIQNEDDLKTVIAADPELVGMSQSTQKVSASDSTGFKAVMLSLLGDYEMTITDYEYRNNNNTYYSHSISIERDWPWICSCGIFALLLYCTFRTIGGICARF